MSDESETTGRRPVYLDHHATTPVDPRVLHAMLPYFSEKYGNAASVDHLFGNEAQRAVEESREKIADLISAEPQEIVFTSGATEADNLAILGVAERHSSKGGHIITCSTEHKAVLDPSRHLESKGFRVTYLAVDRHGLVDLEQLRSAIASDTVLISVMAANNEVGTVAPLAEIGHIAREHEVLFHTDAAQAFGHIPLDVSEMAIDLLSISGHKIYGPKGIGALYVRCLRPRVKLSPQMHGGGHERGMRSGTLNVPGIVGLGEAADIARREMATETVRLRELRDYLWRELQACIAGIELNGHPDQRLPHNLNVYIPGVDSRALLVKLKHVAALSTGSACTSMDVEPSHVILAMGYDENRAHSSVRFGLGRSTQSRADLPIDQIAESVAQLRRMG